MLRIVFAVPLIAHGLAHLSGFLAAWTPANTGFPDKPWIFTSSVYLSGPLGKVFGVLWLLSLLGLAGSGLGILLRQDWWTILAIAGAILSLVAIVPWWQSVPPGAWVGAAFDILVILVLATPLKDRILELLG
jgi:hypothetical protein